MLVHITIENQHWTEIRSLYYQIDYSLTEVPGTAAYFHAQWRRSMTTREHPEHTIVDDIRGRGHYVGTVLAWTQMSDGWWGEGEVKFYMDGDEEYPTLCGTGMEDYFGSAWGIGEFNTPYHGAPLVRGGRVVTATDVVETAVAIAGGTIVGLGPEALLPPADRVIDASGKYVLPGMIDPHTHLDMPFGGTVTIDDVESGHTSAAFGGTTCHVDFVIQPQGMSFGDALDEWKAKANGKALIDIGYHMAVTDLHDGGTLEELATLPDQGVTSYKLFMAYKGAVMVDDETLFRAMQVAADSGALVMVHAENGDAIDVLVKEALAAGHTEPKYHALTRPPETEGEATNRAIQLSRVAGSPLYVVHVSCAEAVEPIAIAREKGWNIHGETCTQYFFVDYTFLERPDFEGAKYVYTPPPRYKANQDVLWNAVRTDILSVVSTDHCAFLWDGQKTMGRDDFSKIPNGGPGIENRLHMIHEFGVRQGRITLNRMVELLCTNPAKLFGLYPRKGTIAVGSDADIVVFDPHATHIISADTHHMDVDYSAYEGWEMTGKVETVLSKGKVIVSDDTYHGSPGDGEYLARGTSQYVI